jgi:hypothetical protein
MNLFVIYTSTMFLYHMIRNRKALCVLACGVGVGIDDSATRHTKLDTPMRKPPHCLLVHTQTVVVCYRMRCVVLTLSSTAHVSLLLLVIITIMHTSKQ